MLKVGQDKRTQQLPLTWVRVPSFSKGPEHDTNKSVTPGDSAKFDTNWALCHHCGEAILRALNADLTPRIVRRESVVLPAPNGPFSDHWMEVSCDGTSENRIGSGLGIVGFRGRGVACQMNLGEVGGEISLIWLIP